MKPALRVSPVDRVISFGRSVIAFACFRRDGPATERDRKGLHSLLLIHEHHPMLALNHDNPIDGAFWKRARRQPSISTCDKQKNKYQSKNSFDGNHLRFVKFA